jgi:hypothetical protein
VVVVRLDRFAALLPVVVAGVCTAYGVATSGWGEPTRAPLPLERTGILPPRPLVNGAAPPPSVFITAAHGGAKVFKISPMSRDAGAPD